MTAEQVTERLTSQLQTVSGRIKALPYKTVRKLICLVLILWIVLSFFQLVWIFLPSSESSDSSPATAPTDQPQQSIAVDIVELRSLSLFGKAGEQTAVVAEASPIQDDAELNATKTRLNLTLEGIVHTPDGASSLAVIVYQGKQDQYYIGDKLPVGSRVELARVLIDHVILDNAGNYESLWLYDDEKERQSRAVARRSTPSKQPVRVTDIRNDRQLSDMAQDYRQRLYKNPSSLSEVLRISPAQKDGELLGYRVSPGKDRTQFAQLGFETNDIVTSINGITLDEPSKALEIYKLMRTAKQASFTVDRKGQPVEVLVALGDSGVQSGLED